MRLLLICFLLGSFKSLAQDPISEQMKWYDLAQSNTNLFVHFDKNVYTNNETVWFTGYLLKQKPITFNKHQVLAVALIRDIDSTILVQDKFLIMEGITFGSFKLPDSLITGEYKLLAYTDILIAGKPEAVFVQPITIKTNLDLAFKANLKILKTADVQNTTNQILLSLTSKEGSFFPKPANVNYKFGNLQKSTKTDASGQLLINLPPQNNLTDPNLYVKLSYQKDSSFIQIPLPQNQTKATVKFYPEGGNMVTDLPISIGWEVKDQQKKPMALTAFLYKNNEVIDTIETNSYGMGKFRLIPEENTTYHVKLNHSNIIDSNYVLPKAIGSGLVMDLTHAVTRDTLTVGLRSNSTRQFFIRIHNFRESFVYFPFDMKFDKRTIKIPLDGIPKGLATLTITDSLDRPLAERMFFAHYNNDEKIKLSTDQPVYKKRERVTLELTLPQADEQAFVSIACVQDNRLTQKMMTDIESYSYLNRELVSLPISLTGRPIANEAYLENILLIRGWRKYSWQGLQLVTPKDTLIQLSYLSLKGQASRNKNKLKEPLTLATLNGFQMNMTTTAKDGSFDLSNEFLFTDAEKKLFLFPDVKNNFLYDITVSDPYRGATNSLLNELPNLTANLPSSFIDNSELSIRFDEKAIRLNEVSITGRKDNSFSFGSLIGANACGDYVCKFNILNCVNHGGDDGNRQPIAGKQYRTNNRMTIVYMECQPNVINSSRILTPVNGIHMPKEFYVNDYAEPEEPAFFSTIYWNYEAILKGSDPTKVSFYTSDITGKFKVVVQGVNKNDVIYAEHFFEVKP